ncbi:hypothetical protein AVEN_49433-1 [Araneus ventricosus]|uniref:Uncharacterized protein n=1 Tax=Araneus ventricosus TaxID=182803 RepID=A0A4Y2CNQ7_ARAVE|nr:hypothetical protein AVEN_49433-1 [Araneus ventricosus]
MTNSRPDPEHSSPTSYPHTRGRLTDKDLEWKGLDRKFRALIDQIDTLHKDGLSNSLDCISSEMKKGYQDCIELIEDKIMRIGDCPVIGCGMHKTKVRRSSLSNVEFKMVSPRKIAKPKDNDKNFQISTENKFSTLMDIDTPDENNPKIEDIKRQILEMNLKLDSNYNLTLQKINRLYPDTENRLYKGFISIQAPPLQKLAIILLIS